MTQASEQIARQYAEGVLKIYRKTWDGIIYNVKAYGALGDGVTNDSAAIQYALNDAAAAGGGTVVFSARKTYIAQFTIPQNVSIEGNFCTFKPPSGSTGPVITFDTYVSHGSFRRFFILGTGTSLDTTQHGIYVPRTANATAGAIKGMNNSVFEQIIIRSLGGNGMHLEGGNYFDVIQLNTFRNCILQSNTGHGMYQDGQVQSNLFQNVWCYGNTKNGMRTNNYLEGVTWYTSNANKFLRCNFEESGLEGVYEKGRLNIFDTCWFEGNSRTDLTHSTGYYVDSIFTESATKLIGCTFAQHNRDIWLYKGDSNQIDKCSFQWSGNPATKASCIVAEVNSSYNDFGRNQYDMNPSGSVPNVITSTNTFAITPITPAGNDSVASGASFVDIVFPKTEYVTPKGIGVSPTWNTGWYLTAINRSGFRINFTTAPGSTQTVYWITK